mgnify:CR=1 FL=1
MSFSNVILRKSFRLWLTCIVPATQFVQGSAKPQSRLPTHNPHDSQEKAPTLSLLTSVGHASEYFKEIKIYILLSELKMG